MKLRSISLRNFRCFGPASMVVALDGLTTFVGENGCGKSAVLQALRKLFGVTSADRRLERMDFHVPAGVDPNDQTEQDLSLEVVIDFPELQDDSSNDEADQDDIEDDDDQDQNEEEEDGDEDDDADTAAGVAECFRNMAVDDGTTPPYCRILLEATWTKTNVPEGVIEEHIYWLTTADDEPDDTHKKPLRGHERTRIHTIYVPASRDPSEQLRSISRGSVLSLLKAANWEKTGEEIEEAAKKIQQEFDNTPAVAAIQEHIAGRWGTLYKGRWFNEPGIRPLGTTLSELLRRIRFSFKQPESGVAIDDGLLSDGLASLFYLTIVAAAFDVEQTILKDVDEAIFDTEAITPPDLTIFAIEEPENHLAPHYLARIIAVLQSIADNPRGQVALSSHSPSILRRVDPRNLRHVRLLPDSQTTVIRSLNLPSEKDEAFKFVKEAVQAYPELYFSRFVVLCEGDSEELILPRIAKAAGLELDQEFISVVPLGGRHVNHFWKLLTDLAIPYVTLLDLDRERHGGGWGRIKYALRQLLENGVPRKKLLHIATNGTDGVLSDGKLEAMNTWDVTHTTTLTGWLNRLERFGVYYSQPLDVDFLMLTQFTEAYKELDDGEKGPDIPDQEENDIDFNKRIKRAVRVTLGDRGGDGATYTPEEKALFPWYTYRFLGQGKPSTHLLAFGRLTEEELLEDMPDVFEKLVASIRDTLKLPASKED
jgi:putative ATP-dependent endonuclease of the OLD family